MQKMYSEQRKPFKLSESFNHNKEQFMRFYSSYKNFVENEIRGYDKAFVIQNIPKFKGKKFSLLYQASADGFDCKVYHEKWKIKDFL